MPSVLIATAIVLVGLGLFASEHAIACSCAPISMKKAFKRSDAAITGRLVEVRDLDEQRTDYVYRVRRVYKGRHRIEAGQLLEVRSARDGTACGLPRRQGRRSGIFLYRNARHHRWTSSLCSVVSARRMQRFGERRDDGGPKRCPAS